MKRLVLLFVLSIIPLSVNGQGHAIFSDEDPAFDYIQTYLPEYYYEEDFAGGTRNAVEFYVRTLHNYLDDKTFSYFILVHDSEWGCLDVDEIDSIITYLERVYDRSSFPSKTATVVYNTRRGFKFEAQQGRPIFLYFPKNGPECEIKNPSIWINALKNGKEFVMYDTQFVSWTDLPDDGHGYYAAKAVARVKLRHVVGSLPKPKSVVNEKGKVVVQIEVDQYGNVVDAIPGADGTTLMNQKQWDETRSAAMKTHFNASANASVVQRGTITYSFDGLTDDL